MTALPSDGHIHIHVDLHSARDESPVDLQRKLNARPPRSLIQQQELNLDRPARTLGRPEDPVPCIEWHREAETLRRKHFLRSCRIDPASYRAPHLFNFLNGRSSILVAHPQQEIPVEGHLSGGRHEGHYYQGCRLNCTQCERSFDGSRRTRLYCSWNGISLHGQYITRPSQSSCS